MTPLPEDLAVRRQVRLDRTAAEVSPHPPETPFRGCREALRRLGSRSRGSPGRPAGAGGPAGCCYSYLALVRAPGYNPHRSADRGLVQLNF